MTNYELMTFLHIIVIVVGFGPSFAFPFLQAFGERNGVAATLFAQRAIGRINSFLVFPAAILTPILGVGLLFEVNYDEDFPGWLMAAITWYVIAVVLDLVIVDPANRRAIRVLENTPDGATLPDEYLPLGKRLQIGGGLISLSIIGIALVMVWKP